MKSNSVCDTIHFHSVITSLNTVIVFIGSGAHSMKSDRCCWRHDRNRPITDFYWLIIVDSLSKQSSFIFAAL